MKSIGIIPARGGSKSIPLKNLRDFNGRPLISWTIDLALKSHLDRVIVSTDSSEIAAYAKSVGADVPFHRPWELAQDSSRVEDVLKHAYEFLVEEENCKPDALALLLPTSPFRIQEDIDSAIGIFLKKHPTSVVSVRRAIATANPYWMIARSGSGKVMLMDGKPLKQMLSRRQDLPEVFIKNDYVFLLNPANLYEDVPNLYGDDVELLVSDDERDDVDINTEKDWRMAEILFRMTRC